MYKTVKIPKLNINQIHRFVAKIKQTDSCWEWIGPLRKGGYGCFGVNSHTYSAHRIAYELFNDTEIPEKMTLDHLCFNRLCVNPKHLEAVTVRENIVRGLKTNTNRKKRTKLTTLQTHCRRGHLLDAANILYRWFKNTKYRSCKTCKYAAYKNRYHKAKNQNSVSSSLITQSK